MSRYIRFGAGGSIISVRPPQWGYTVDVQLPLTINALAGHNYGSWDDAAAGTYDGRLCKCSFLMNETDANAMQDFFMDPTKGRGATVNLALGTNSGFYPGGPDKTSSGDFSVACVELEPSGMLHRPMKWFDISVTLQVLSMPVTSVPTQRDQGNLQIGTVTGLRYPQDGYGIEILNSCGVAVGMANTISVTDIGTDADRHETKIRLTGNTSKMAALANEFAVTIRNNDFSIITQANNYPYGRAKGGSGTFTSQLISNVLTFTHYGFDQWAMEFRASLKAVA